MPSARPRSATTGGGAVRGGFEGVVDPASRRALLDLRKQIGVVEGDGSLAVAIAGLPRGLVAVPKTISVDQTGITTAADLTGFTATVAVEAGRWYKVSWLVTVTQNTAQGAQVFFVNLGGSDQIINRPTSPAAFRSTQAGSLLFSGGVASINGNPFVVPGSKIIKMRGSTTAGTMDINNNGLSNGRFWVEDVGATAAVPI